MTEQRYGHIIVSGDAADLSIAAKAYAGQTQPVPVQDLLTRDFRFEAHTTADFRAHKPPLLVPNSVTKDRPLGRVAYGYTLPGVQWVNNSKSVADQIYAYRHEPFHPLYSKNISKAKAKMLRTLVIKVPGGSAYQNRLSETWCDAMVELFWGRGSILDDFYADIPDADLEAAFRIVMAGEQNPEPVPPEPPLPLPLPDPQIAALEAELAKYKTAVSFIRNALVDIP